jgi:uncharacterized cupin superfamily protein
VYRHTREDEAWIVLDGEVTVFVDDEQPDLDRLLAGMREHGIEFLAPTPAQ